MSKRSSGSAAAAPTRRHLQHLYDQLWSSAIDSIKAGKVGVDPVLASRLPDRRRGLTLIARPSQAVRQRVSGFLDELQTLEPGQHYYAASEFHVTILSLFTAAIDHQRFFANTARYLSAVDSAMNTPDSLDLEFDGVTVSSGTVMIQGFFQTPVINRIRDNLRNRLRHQGLTEGLDQRYRLETAHMTVVRFCAPLRNGKQFATALKQARHRWFGESKIVNLSLVQNDWYMSRRSMQTVKRYRLRCA